MFCLGFLFGLESLTTFPVQLRLVEQQALDVAGDLLLES